MKNKTSYFCSIVFSVVVQNKQKVESLVFSEIVFFDKHLEFSKYR